MLRIRAPQGKVSGLEAIALPNDAEGDWILGQNDFTEHFAQNRYVGINVSSPIVGLTVISIPPSNGLA